MTLTKKAKVYETKYPTIIICQKKLRTLLENPPEMKQVRIFFLTSALTLILSSCNLFKPKYGCESNGKNVGAEKILDGGSKKTPKFKA